MVKNELRSVFHNPLMILVLLAIMLIPSIYAGLFLSSMWDPYGDLKNLPVAVVNDDKSVVYNDKRISIGDDLANELKNSDAMAFNVVDRDTARKGLENGTYYMVITIPKDFSTCASSVMDKKPQKMRLDYETNPGKNYIASKLSESAVKEIKSNLMAQVTKTYTEKVFNGIQKAGEGYETAAKGTDDMLTGEDKLIRGNGTITSNLKLLANSTLTFQNGSDTLVKGLKTYTDGIAKVDEGLQTFGSGAEKLSNGAIDGSKKIADGADALNIGLIKYTAGVNTAKKGADKLVANNSELNDGVENLSLGMNLLQTGSSELEKGLKKIQVALNNSLTDDKVLKIKQAETGLKKLGAGIGQLNLEINGDGTPEHPGIDVSGVQNLLEDIGTNTGSAGAKVQSAATKLQLIATGEGAMSKAVNAEMLQFAADYSKWKAGETSYYQNLKNDLQVLTYICGKDRIIEILIQKSLFDHDVEEIMNAIADEGSIASGIESAGSDLNDVGGNLSNIGRNLNTISQSGLIGKVNDLKVAVKEISDASNQLCVPSANALQTMLGGMQEIQTAFNQTQEKAGKAGVIQGITELNQGMSLLQLGIDSKYGLKNGVKKYTSGVETLKRGLGTITKNNDKLVTGANSLSRGGNSLAKGLEYGMGSLKHGSEKLLLGTEALVNGSPKLISGTDKLSDGAGKIADGSLKLYDGSSALGNGLDDLSNGTKTLNEALKNGAKEVKGNKASDDNIDMFVSPVDTKETQITNVENNGHAMAAYMLTVGLWVGCIAFCLMYPLARYRGKFVNGRRWWLSKAVILYPLSILQALVVLFILNFVLGFEPQDWPLMILLSILVSQTFMAIMYFFNVLMGKVGSFIMVIFMVLQLAGAAGTYPVEISGSMVAAIHDYMPFTYAVDAFRSVISGGASIEHQVVVLLSILVVFTGLTIIVFRYRGQRIRQGKPTIYDFIEEKGMA